MSKTDLETAFKPIRLQMESAGLDQRKILNFKQYFHELIRGSTGMITRAEIKPVNDIPRTDSLAGMDIIGSEAIKATTVIKLNGGLGTSMGMEKAKSLLPVKGNLRFLDIIIRQIINLRGRYDARIPLILMNSSTTRNQSLAVLAEYPELDQDVPKDFVQSKVPKIRQQDYRPVSYPSNPELEWCPPGHGDIYLSMVVSGILDQLLERGYRYAFVSNADNLGALVDLDILGYFADKNLPFMMEVAERTSADRKGGHLARLNSGKLTLREIAQCPPDEVDEFQNIDLYRYFNTNTIWLNLEKLRARLVAQDDIVALPLIRNSKTVNPKDPGSTPVYQLETAMGAALSLFEGAAALHVPRRRFLPVKTCQDLLGLWSDAYRLTEEFCIVQTHTDQAPVVTSLDQLFYRMIDQLIERFPHGAPSLQYCRRFSVEGDIRFGSNIRINGDVTILNRGKQQAHLPDGTFLENETLEI